MANGLQKLIGEIAEHYPKARIEFDPLPSGVCVLDVWVGDRMFEMEYHPKRGTGVSEITEQTVPFSGHDHGFESLPAAIDFFKERLAEAAGELSRTAVLKETNH